MALRYGAMKGTFTIAPYIAIGITGAAFGQGKPDGISLFGKEPMPIQRWIERHGGHEKLPLDGFWTMYDHELWAMGYPKCE